MEFKSILTKRNNRGGRACGRDVRNTIAYNITQRKQRPSNPILTFSIGKNLCKKVGFVKGDLIDLAVSDCGEYGCLCRNNERGRTLTASGPNMLVVSFAIETVFMRRPGKTTELQDVIVSEGDGEDDSGILSLIFSIPKPEKNNIKKKKGFTFSGQLEELDS